MIIVLDIFIVMCIVAMFKVKDFLIWHRTYIRYQRLLTYNSDLARAYYSLLYRCVKLDGTLSLDNIIAIQNSCRIYQTRTMRIKAIWDKITLRLV